MMYYCPACNPEFCVSCHILLNEGNKMECPECLTIKCRFCYENAECPIHGQMCADCYYSNHLDCESSSSSSSSENSSSSSSSGGGGGCVYCGGS